jgi:hypothetical protein
MITRKSLRQHDQLHGLALVEAQGRSRLALAAGYRADAGANHFGNKSGGIDS